MANELSAANKKPGTVASITFTPEQRETLESHTGLKGLTGIDLVDLDAEARTKLAPGLVRVTAVVMCW
jgi:hypothetical protein